MKAISRGCLTNNLILPARSILSNVRDVGRLSLHQSESGRNGEDMTKMEKLERLHNRATLYELAADNKYLVGYCKPGKLNMLRMLQKNGESWVKRINDGDLITFAKNGRSAQIGKFAIAFTGRTQRESICAGELDRKSVV